MWCWKNQWVGGGPTVFSHFSMEENIKCYKRNAQNYSIAKFYSNQLRFSHDSADYAVARCLSVCHTLVFRRNS